MNVSVKQLRAFVAVASTRSFTEACSQIHLSQPALSIAIKNIEEAVGGPLLTRTTRAIALTPEGEDFLPVAKRLIKDWDGAFSDLNNRFALAQGRVEIAAMPSYACNLLPYIMKEYRELYPNVNITVQDVVAESVVEMVRTGRVEVGISFDPGESDELSFSPIYSDRFIAVCSPDHPLAGESLVSWKQLLRYDMVALQRPSVVSVYIEQALAEYGMTFPVVFESHQLATVGRMVATGLGVSVVPSLCRQQMEELGALCLSLQAPAVEKEVGIITRKRHPLSVAARAMVDVIRASEHSRPKWMAS